MCCFTLFNLQGTRSCSPLSRTAYIYYHKLFRLSTPFSFFFANRSLQKSDPSCFRSKRTFLLYCAVLDLSSTFFLPVIQLLRFIRKKKRSSSELDYYTMPSSNCQVLFRLFLRERKSAAGSIRRRSGVFS